jgi:hypothetical protein
MTKKPVYQYVNADQCRNTSRRIHVNAKSQIADDGLMSRNMLQEMTSAWCVHTAYCGGRMK